MPSIFVTGAGGCVGHYLVDTLVPDYDLFLLVRNPGKLRFAPDSRKNIKVITGDLEHLEEHSDLLSRMDYCVHAATAWGGEKTEYINVNCAHRLFNLLNPERARRIVYFSTASILGRDLKVLPEAEKFGTDYIKTKSRCYRELSRCRLHDRIVTVFPTLVFGGDRGHPVSHASKGLSVFRRYARLLGRINVEFGFHFIHARDIAAVVRSILEAPRPEKMYVLGNEPLTIGQFTRRAAGYFGHKIRRQVTFTPETLYRFARVLGIEVSSWDRFCAGYKDFRYPAVNCATFGLPSRHRTVEEIMADWRVVVS